MKEKEKSKIPQSISLLLLGGVAVFAIVSLVYFSMQKNQADKNVSNDRGSAMVNYTGRGYQISYPSDWLKDDTKQEAPATVFTSPDRKAKLYIQSFYDPRLTKSSEQSLTIADIKESFKQNPGYTVVSNTETTVGGNSAYMVEGTYKEQEKQLEFQEYTIFGDDGYYYSLRINNEPGQYQKALDVMVSTFKITTPNQDEVKARESVISIVEVQKYKKQVEASGRSTFGVRVDRTPTKEEPYYIVQVYETFPDHMTTFNWYRVDPGVWIVERQDLVTDTWKKVR